MYADRATDIYDIQIMIVRKIRSHMLIAYPLYS